MINKGNLKGVGRKEENWTKVKLGEPFHEVLEEFREKVLPRDDFDATSLLQFGLFMAKALINVLTEAEKKLGKKGQQVIIDALIKTGYEIGSQIVHNISIPQNIPDIELMSFLATIINTQAWTSIEAPKIQSDTLCSFDILWCPLQRIYKAFDCRVQRYLVQGIINAFNDSKILKHEYQIDFKSTIPAGAETCYFSIVRKVAGEKDKWEDYSEDLEQKALRKYKI
ncbi:MAG: hypothetical protein ACFE9R_07500 [Candidatus Hermodarchaeota archaeon]